MGRLEEQSDGRGNKEILYSGKYILDEARHLRELCSQVPKPCSMRSLLQNVGCDVDEKDGLRSAY